MAQDIGLGFILTVAQIFVLKLKINNRLYSKRYELLIQCPVVKPVIIRCYLKVRLS